MTLTLWVLNFTSCKKDEKDAIPEIAEIKLSVSSPVDISIDTTKEVTITGGDGKTYVVENSDNTKATTSLQGNKLTITPLSHGSVTIKIKSGGKVAELLANIVVPEITLSEASPVELLTRETKEITLTGGNGTIYSVQNSNQEAVKATIQEGKLIIMGMSQGEAKLTISSAGKQTELDVKVVFSATSNGISDLEGKVIFESKYNLAGSNKVQLFKNGSERRTGPMLQIDFISRPEVGKELTLTIFNSRGLPDDFAPNTTITGKVIGSVLNRFQLQTDKYIFVLPCKI